MRKLVQLLVMRERKREVGILETDIAIVKTVLNYDCSEVYFALYYV